MGQECAQCLVYRTGGGGDLIKKQERGGGTKFHLVFGIIQKV